LSHPFPLIWISLYVCIYHQSSSKQITNSLINITICIKYLCGYSLIVRVFYLINILPQWNSVNLRAVGWITSKVPDKLSMEYENLRKSRLTCRKWDILSLAPKYSKEALLYEI
jgi:hypothetical protein